MLKQRNEDFYNSMVSEDNNLSIGERAQNEVETKEFKDEILSLFEEQLNRPLDSIKIDLVNQVDTSNTIEDKSEVLEEFFNRIINKFKLNIDNIDAIKGDYTELKRVTHFLYTNFCLTPLESFTAVFTEVLFENTTMLKTLFKSLGNENLTKQNTNFIKKNLSDSAKDHYMIFGIIDRILGNEINARLVFANEYNYNIFDSEAEAFSTLGTFLSNQNKEALNSIVHFFTGNSLFLNFLIIQIKNYINLDAAETKYGTDE